MKKIYFSLFTILSLSTGQTFAQVSSYVFTQSSGTYTPITGTLVAAATSANPNDVSSSAQLDDFTFANIPIGFPFKFNGVSYTNLNANTNGWISFGAVTSSISTPISSTNAYNAVVSASAFDLMGVFTTSATRTLGSNVLTAVANTSYCVVGKPIQGEGIPAGSTITAFDATSITISNAASASSAGTFVSFATGEIRSEVTGIAPNRTFTIQYSGFSSYTASLIADNNNNSISFQFKLFEGGTNGDLASASVVYGTYFRTSGSSTTEVGLRGNSNTDFNNRTTTTNWSLSNAGVSNASTVTFSNTVFPAIGLTYTWTASAFFVDYCNLQFPPTATITQGGSAIVYTRGYEPGVTEAPGPGPGLTVWIGTNASNTDPATWPASAWSPTTFNVQVGNDDEFSLAIGSSVPAGTYYYASRWLITGGNYRYGGYNATGGNYWDGTNNVSGVLTVNAPPPPANDLCAGAIALTPGTACNYVTFNTTGATDNNETGECTAGTENAVWFSFVATQTTMIVNVDGGTTFDAVVGVFTACGSTTSPTGGGCTDNTFGGEVESLNLSGLTVGATYLIQVYDYEGDNSVSSTFDICVFVAPPPPSNDNCSNAAVISSTPVSSTTLGATQSQAPLACVGATSNDAIDVWFSFTALSSGDATLTLSNATGGLDAVIQAFSGSCGTLTNIGCADATFTNGNEVVTLNGLTAGQTYFIEVYGYDGTAGSFDITVSGAALPISVEYFRGTKQSNAHLLDWKVTCYNSPSVKMEVERSADGRRFNTIQSQTETALRCLQPFSFADTDPLAGINYYRLKSTDVDGKITYSATVAILNKTKGFEIVSMIPNPVETKAILSISSAVKATMEIVVTDLAGKQLSKQRVVLIAGSNQVPLNLSNLAAGTYQVTGITDEGERKSVRFVKQ